MSPRATELYSIPRTGTTDKLFRREEQGYSNKDVTQSKCLSRNFGYGRKLERDRTGDQSLEADEVERDRTGDQSLECTDGEIVVDAARV